MAVDVAELAAFYGTPLGVVARRAVARAVAELWSDLAGTRLLGLGFTAPVLDELPLGRCERALAFMPGRQGAVPWPDASAPRACLVDPAAMPLPDGSVDRILLVHALEGADDPDELLREVSRLLSPTGRAVIVCPNRRGLWARLDTTPFGTGQPFSRSQLRRRLGGAHLRPTRWAETLYMPPFRSTLLLRSAAAWETLGHGLSLPFAGLHVVEAVRSEPVPARIRGRVRARRRPALLPVPASPRPAPVR